MTSLTFKSDGAARFFLCQYVSDPFRQEPRNVGVIVQSKDGVACLFQGESEDGNVDGRKLRQFADPDNYRNWVHFWRRTAEKKASSLERALLAANRDSFRVVSGGYLGDVASDSASQLVKFLFSSLVSNDEFDEAIGNETPEVKSSPQLATEVAKMFRQQELTEAFSRPNAIYRSRDLIGKQRPWRFEFVQLNGQLVPMEVFDFRKGSQKAIDHHVAWACNAFTDVREANAKPTNPQAIVMPPERGTNASLKECFELALESLPRTSKVIRWDTMRESFLRERREMADGAL